MKSRIENRRLAIALGAIALVSLWGIVETSMSEQAYSMLGEKYEHQRDVAGTLKYIFGAFALSGGIGAGLTWPKER